MFPDSLIRLCLFHFAQALWRKLQELGLVGLYKSNRKARVLLRCFGALATVPLADVKRALDEIVGALQVMLNETGEIPRDLEPALARKWAARPTRGEMNNLSHALGFEDYFEKTYVHRYAAQGQGYAAPRYRPALWNCYLPILQELHRTNNGKRPEPA